MNWSGELEGEAGEGGGIAVAAAAPEEPSPSIEDGAVGSELGEDEEEKNEMRGEEKENERAKDREVGAAVCSSA